MLDYNIKVKYKDIGYEFLSWFFSISEYSPKRDSYHHFIEHLSSIKEGKFLYYTLSGTKTLAYKSNLMLFLFA
jgi:hypothetical protein